MSNAADTYVHTMERLQAGVPLSEISTEDLSLTALAVRCDVEDRLGRLNRFGDARDALERVGQLADELRGQLVRIVAVREGRGAKLSADDEALLAFNAAHMLEMLRADLERRGAPVN